MFARSFYRFAPAIALMVVAVAAGAARAHAQTASHDPAAALFDDTVVHDLQLTISTRDWQSLKEHFRENTRYPADLRWRDQTARNIAVRSRGNGSRSGTKPRSEERRVGKEGTARRRARPQ